MMAAVKEPWWSALEARVVENPAYISVVIRWITWAVAAAVVAFRAAPAENLEHAQAALVVTGLWCVAISIYGPLLRPRPPVRNFAAWTSAFDIMLSCAVIYATGGFRSPFYEFALTSVIAPSLLFRMRGGLLAAASFCTLYFVAVVRSAPGMEAVVREGVVDGTLFSSILTPFTIAVFCALLGHAMRQLHLARLRTRELAALEERSRIAREIHDGIAQRMFMLSLTLETCAEVAGRAGQDALRERLDDLTRLSKQALWEVRHYIFDLKPLLEGEAALLGSVRNQVREFESVSGIAVALEVSGTEREMSTAGATALFRIVQEALANVYKHAGASNVTVGIDFAATEVRVRVQDDGRGFEAAPSGGMGVGGMRQRAAEAGGTLEVRSTLGGGTAVAASLPYQTKEVPV
jgi:signal transduction histidine kinase